MTHKASLQRNNVSATTLMQPIPPVVARAQAVKAEFADSENFKIKLENKEESIKDLKRQLKLKVLGALRLSFNPLFFADVECHLSGKVRL